MCCVSFKACVACLRYEKKPQSQKITQLISAAITIAGSEAKLGTRLGIHRMPSGTRRENGRVSAELAAAIDRATNGACSAPKAAAGPLPPRSAWGGWRMKPSILSKPRWISGPFFSATSSSKRSLPVSGAPSRKGFLARDPAIAGDREDHSAQARNGIPDPAGTDDFDMCFAYVRAVAMTPRCQT